MKSFIGILTKGKLDIVGVTEFLKSLEDGVILMNISRIDEIIKYRKQYFAMIDEIVLTTGYTKSEVHETMVKKEVLPLITHKSSTKDLILDEWPIFIEAVREYFYEKLDIVI